MKDRYTSGICQPTREAITIRQIGYSSFYHYNLKYHQLDSLCTVVCLLVDGYICKFMRLLIDCGEPIATTAYQQLSDSIN